MLPTNDNLDLEIERMKNAFAEKAWQELTISYKLTDATCTAIVRKSGQAFTVAGITIEITEGRSVIFSSAESDHPELTMLRYAMEFADSDWDPGDEDALVKADISIKGTHSCGLIIEICGKGLIGEDGSQFFHGEFEQPAEVYVDPPKATWRRPSEIMGSGKV